jgi:hypothetical protein
VSQSAVRPLQHSVWVGDVFPFCFCTFRNLLVGVALPPPPSLPELPPRISFGCEFVSYNPQVPPGRSFCSDRR